MTPSLFNRTNFRAGDILHTATTSILSRTIMRVLGSVGSHDALVMAGGIGVGESVPLRARITPWADYEKNMLAGKVRVSVLRCPYISGLDGAEITWIWKRDIEGTPYDFGAFPRLFLKSIFGDICEKAAGWEWANWCTEGIRHAYITGTGNMCDPWGKTNPTPRTTEKAMLDGFFMDVTDECLTAEGQKYRLDLSGVKK